MNTEKSEKKKLFAIDIGKFSFPKLLQYFFSEILANLDDFITLPASHYPQQTIKSFPCQ